MKSRVANESLADVLDRHTAAGAPELCRPEGDRLRCLACGHRCLVGEGLRGICKVRFNDAGTLRVPFGYVAGVQCDPVEKKPFFHVHPGRDALTFGMMGCDLHCAYCFPGDTAVVTDRGVLPIRDVFQLGKQFTRTPDAEIAHPVGLRAVTASGTLRPVVQVFKHRYAGPLTVLRPYYLPPLRCTPEHRVYATDDPTKPPAPLEARRLSPRHLLAVPRRMSLSQPNVERMLVTLAGAAIERRCVVTDDYYLVPLRGVETEPFEGDVYNLEVEEERNYLANFALVKNCQNWVTSQALRDPAAAVPVRPVTATQLVDAARREGARLVVSSYNEPLITAEWAVAVFREAVEAGLDCAFVSNGNATPEVLDYLRPWLVAYKVDLKSFNDRNYRSLGGTLDNITRTIQMVHERGLWLEVVTLVVPGFNDSEDELRQMARFLASVSPDIPWHVTAFHQDYRMTDPDATSAATLVRACEIGTEEGLRFVYAGNLPGRVGEWENTRCPSCRATLVERFGYLIRAYRLTPAGRCPHCDTQIPGVWPESAAAVPTGQDEAAFRNRLPRRVPVAGPTLEIGTGRLADRERRTQPPVASGGQTMPPQLTDEQKQQLVAATAGMLRALVVGQPATFPAGLDGLRDLPVSGAFVSLKRGKHLRSCCGLIGGTVPLHQALERAADRAIWEDERFPPVSLTELDRLDLEIWLLYAPRRVAARGEERAAGIVIGKHGVKVIRGNVSGLFLPSVAAENGWDARRLLEQVCAKAGLPTTAWLDDDTELYTFEGEALRAALTNGDARCDRLAGPCRPDETAAYADRCRANLASLLAGLTPRPFAGLPDGRVNGVLLVLHQPSADAVRHYSRFSLRPGLPLQSTLFALVQSAAQDLAAQGFYPEALDTLNIGVVLLHDPVLHGSVADPHLAGFDPRHRALLVLERGKAGLALDPARPAEELLATAAQQARVTRPDAAALYSLDAVGNVERLSVSTVPPPAPGPATRPAAVAGSFYPADTGELTRLVDRLLEGERRAEPWSAALVPHAGLNYSGQLAAAVLRRLRIPKTVIVLGPKHTPLGVEWAVAPHRTWALPGGHLASDPDLARKLCDAIPGLELDAAAHQREHAIEVELPLLARLAPETRVLGVVLGPGDLDGCRRFAAGLADVVRGLDEPPLLLISSDMNHFADDAATRHLDALALAALETGDPAALYDVVTRHHISMCGVLPAVVVLETLRLLGRFTKAERVGYATSGDVTGDRGRVVGYAGVLLG